MSCEIIKPRESKKDISFHLNFDIDDSGGYTFPCDQNGNVFSDLNEYALRNYEWCKEHPEKFIRKAYVEKREISYTENAIAKCICGEEFELYDEYMGACSCPKCERWYNIFGQELIDPKYWENEEEDW